MTSTFYKLFNAKQMYLQHILLMVSATSRFTQKPHTLLSF